MFKKFCITVLSVISVIIIAAGSVVYTIDPFNHYRADSDFTKIIYQMPYYQNVGIAKYTEYDALITGSSMTQNFRAYWFDEKFGYKSIRLSFDGGLIGDFSTLLKIALDNNAELKAVYFGIDNYMITGDSALNSENDRIPDYFIDNNPFTDVKYLLNKDVIFKYIPTYFAYKQSDEYDFYEMHAWDNNNPVFSKQAVLSKYNVIERKKSEPNDLFDENAKFFLETLCPLIEENTEVQFTFFAPPYSILYWYSQYSKGTLDATISALNMVYNKLIEYNNVSLFYFQNNYDIITNLDNYKDENHYSAEYNRYMIECFSNGNMRINKNNISSSLNQMKHIAKEFNYNSLFN